MYLRSLLALPLLFGALSHAVAIPAVDCPAPGTPDPDGDEYWLESIARQGVSPLGPSGYTVFRNVRDFGAKGELTASVSPYCVFHLCFSCTDSETRRRSDR
jgi:glucan 1,3-beta-glucosidase